MVEIFSDFCQRLSGNLHWCVLSTMLSSFQTGEHSSVQDAQATVRLYTMHRKDWEKSITERRNKIARNKKKAAAAAAESDDDDEHSSSIQKDQDQRKEKKKVANGAASLKSGSLRAKGTLMYQDSDED